MTGSILGRRAKKIRPAIKVMIISAFDFDKPKKMPPSMEQSGFLQKPFKTTDMCVIVRRHLTEA